MWASCPSTCKSEARSTGTRPSRYSCTVLPRRNLVLYTAGIWTSMVWTFCTHMQTVVSRGGWWYLDPGGIWNRMHFRLLQSRWSHMFLARLLKPSWVRVDDTAAQLSPNFQSEQIKALQVVILKVVKLSPAKAVLFYFQLPCRCDPFR